MIKITDKRIADGKQVAIENIEVEITKSSAKTFSVENQDGSISDTTLNVVESIETTTLKDIDAELSNLTIQRTDLQNQIDALDALILSKTATRDSVFVEVGKI